MEVFLQLANQHNEAFCQSIFCAFLFKYNTIQLYLVVALRFFHVVVIQILQILLFLFIFLIAVIFDNIIANFIKFFNFFSLLVFFAIPSLSITHILIKPKTQQISSALKYYKSAKALNSENSLFFFNLFSNYLKEVV